jgi:hypothetical protein
MPYKVGDHVFVVGGPIGNYIGHDGKIKGIYENGDIVLDITDSHKEHPEWFRRISTNTKHIIYFRPQDFRPDIPDMPVPGHFEQRVVFNNDVVINVQHDVVDGIQNEEDEVEFFEEDFEEPEDFDGPEPDIDFEEAPLGALPHPLFEPPKVDW